MNTTKNLPIYMHKLCTYISVPIIPDVYVCKFWYKSNRFKPWYPGLLFLSLSLVLPTVKLYCHFHLKLFSVGLISTVYVYLLWLDIHCLYIGTSAEYLSTVYFLVSQKRRSWFDLWAEMTSNIWWIFFC
jgi:hypothetical protein